MNVKEINLTPAELNAILEHKRIMSEKRKQGVTLEQAIEEADMKMYDIKKKKKRRKTW